MSAASSALAPVQGSGGWGVAATIGSIAVRQARPVAFEVFAGRPLRRGRGYDAVERRPHGFAGHARVRLAELPVLDVRDVWELQDARIIVSRQVRVVGSAPGLAFLTSLRVAIEGVSWTDVEPFAPGLVYGNVEQVPTWSIGSPQARRRGVHWILAREDRMAAPIFSVSLADGRWLAIRHLAPTARTVAADGADVRGGVLVDERLETASLGGVTASHGLELGLWMPGPEGETTYESGGLPLRQRRAWRRRYVPAIDGLEQSYWIELTAGTARDRVEGWSRVWQSAWAGLAPVVEPLAADEIVRDAVRVLAGQVRSGAGVSGIPLEVDPTTGRATEPLGPAIMGFVGANTDAAELLIRLGGAAGVPAAVPAGAAILDSFAGLRLDPPAGEGFDLESGRVTTYRRLFGRRAVFARSIAEGAHAAIRASALAGVQPEAGARWRRWALGGGAWLVAAQGADGGIGRAWVARSGRVLQPSTSATATVIPFLVDLGRTCQEDRFIDAAVRAGDHAWRLAGGRAGSFVGATLDNPNVLDKEASTLALEAFLALHSATGDRLWVDRALTAAQVAETWIYIWNVPMPADADASQLDWKPGVPTIGLQLITSGVSMADGFLAADAAAFARLGELTGDEHWLDVARVVTWGPKAMLAVAGRTFDLAGPGWAQEHWSLATRRGHGLNRSWLPWVAVATIRGLLRLRDETPHSFDRIASAAGRLPRAAGGEA
jgi:hypothetical protein